MVIQGCSQACPSNHLCLLAGYPLSLPNSHLVFPGAPGVLFHSLPTIPCRSYILPAHPCQILGDLGYLPRPASSEERTIPTWTFWDPWHRDQMGHYVFLMCLSGVSSGWWALTQDCVLGSWNNHTGYPGTWGMLGEGHDAKRSWWPLWGLRVGSRLSPSPHARPLPQPSVGPQQAFALHFCPPQGLITSLEA